MFNLRSSSVEIFTSYRPNQTGSKLSNIINVTKYQGAFIGTGTIKPVLSF